MKRLTRKMGKEDQEMTLVESKEDGHNCECGDIARGSLAAACLCYECKKTNTATGDLTCAHLKGSREMTAACGDRPAKTGM